MAKKQKRGPKKGVKRGPYNPRKKDLIPQNERFNSKDEIEDPEQIEDPEEIEEIEENLGDDVNNSDIPTNKGGATAEEKYAQFIAEYGKPVETGDKLADMASEAMSNAENKTFDFTNPAPEPEDQKQETKADQMKRPFAQMVNGYMLLALCDFIIPGGILFIWGKFDPRIKLIKMSDCKLDEDQRESLMEAADYAAAAIFEKLNPLVVLLIGMGGFYGMNIKDQVDALPPLPKKVRRPAPEPEPEPEPEPLPEPKRKLKPKKRVR
jgi:hypothetical protein